MGLLFSLTLSSHQQNSRSESLPEDKHSRRWYLTEALLRAGHIQLAIEDLERWQARIPALSCQSQDIVPADQTAGNTRISALVHLWIASLTLGPTA